MTLTCAEYGVAAALTDNVGEDSVMSGAMIMDHFMGRMLHVLTLAIDDDYLALFASLSNSVGTSGADLTVSIAQFGSTRSINAGVAAGIAMHTWIVQHADLDDAW